MQRDGIARRFGGKTALVTGGASGIRRAICLYLARAGANVVIADRNLAAATATAELMEREAPERGIGPVEPRRCRPRHEEMNAAMNFPRPQDCIDRIMVGVARNKAVIVAPRMHALFWILHRITPSAIPFMFTRINTTNEVRGR